MNETTAGSTQPADTSQLDAVFEGGGVKGIALVGAVAATEELTCRFVNVAGTSAGAIVAALVAAGYNAAEMKAILDDLDYRQFKDKDWVDHIPLLGTVLSVGFEKGIYEGRFFEEWLRGLLNEKGIRSFGDLVIEETRDDPRYRYRLQVIAADISRGRMLVLPRDIRDYGFDPDALDVAYAVRMSMSIPFFFEPVQLRNAQGETSYIVDGGVLSNFPVWLLDDGTPDPPWPTIGYKLVEPKAESRPYTIRGPLTLFAALFATMMEAHDARYIADKDFARTVPIDTLDVRTTDFDLSQERAEALYQSGLSAGRGFFEKFDFERYKARYRQQPPPDRQERLLGETEDGP